jgi:hypothetical protein
MEATLTEVINLGNIVQKVYSLVPAFTHNISKIQNVILEYNLENRSVDIINYDTDDVLETVDLSLFDDETPEVSLDKKIFLEFLQLRSIKIYKETDDYSDLL